MKARNAGQRSPNYTMTMQKTTDTVVTVKSIKTTDGEKEWYSRALTHLSRAGVMAKVMSLSFGTISLVKAQLK
jgi:hypothetical protein